ncbi:MAG: hypothetical protein DMF22_01315 [Verrucomicrobia bacterium]|nr:MAG: hypothetical protein DMF22_01315 [Verrucomicrobiota bacterium]
MANSDVSPIAVLGVPPVGSPQSTAKVAIAQKASYKPIKGDLTGRAPSQKGHRSDSLRLAPHSQKGHRSNPLRLALPSQKRHQSS